VDIRPTLLSLSGISDEFTGDGRVITQVQSTPPAAASTPTATKLGLLLKQLDAPVYESGSGADDGFGRATLAADTIAMAGSNDGDASGNGFTGIESRIASITAQRNALSGDIKDKLRQASFAGTPFNETGAQRDLADGQRILDYANALKAFAAGTGPAPADVTAGPFPAMPESGHSALLILTAGGALALCAGVGLRRRERRQEA